MEKMKKPVFSFSNTDGKVLFDCLGQAIETSLGPFGYFLVNSSF